MKTQNLRPWMMEHFRLGRRGLPVDLAAPAYCSISGFGSSCRTDLTGDDLTVQAVGGA